MEFNSSDLINLADIVIDAVEDVLYYADAASRLCHYPGPEVVSSRKAERTASVSSFQILVPSGVSLLASAAPLIDIDEPDRPVEPAIESTLRSAQDLGARSEPGADLGARSEPGAPAQDLGARSEPGT
ncbi:BZ3500_MvSof-1268-A1-R1_Chr4-2g06853 [Microbotryum saponariae]|uniref:BZ3500_MvSof-1268-A1-R1_Chr4-2g06853 protein n=1 Tax=Microbotryum saponariae TaxID=289078 RepID=A0A2X0KWV9_9BASI|nr:BZ3500_MvSof-1268-A1-R1_Chr4-2g06853 [Microbotryum saponariae]SCZ99691.1 BZ3501_MvSof-1269-A2-R1_C29g00052 [Microbotryum saponariae]